jgi:hypothetical protein
VDFLEGSNLVGDLLEGWELPALDSNVPGISGNADEGLEWGVGSSAASIVDKDGLALVQWVGVVQLNSRVSKIEGSGFGAVGKVDVLHNKDETIIVAAELCSLGRNLHLPGQLGELILKLFRGRGGGLLVRGRVRLLRVGVGVGGRVGAGLAGGGGGRRRRAGGRGRLTAVKSKNVELLKSLDKLLTKLFRGSLDTSQIRLLVLNIALSEKKVLTHLENVVEAVRRATSSWKVLLLFKDEMELRDDGTEDVPHPSWSSFLDIDGSNLLSGNDNLEGTLQDLPNRGWKVNLDLFAGGGRGGGSLVALGLGGRGGRRAANIREFILEFLDINIFEPHQITSLGFPGKSDGLTNFHSLSTDGGERNANNALTLNTEDQLVLAIPGTA